MVSGRMALLHSRASMVGRKTRESAGKYRECALGILSEI